MQQLPLVVVSGALLGINSQAFTDCPVPGPGLLLRPEKHLLAESWVFAAAGRGAGLQVLSLVSVSYRALCSHKGFKNKQTKSLATPYGM